MEQLEDVVHTQYQLHIRTFGVHYMRPFWEIHQCCIAHILEQKGIILICKRTPQAFEPDVLAPFQLFKQRNTVEYLTIHVPCKVNASIPVVKKFHVVYQVECSSLHNIR